MKLARLGDFNKRGLFLVGCPVEKFLNGLHAFRVKARFCFVRVIPRFFGFDFAPLNVKDGLDRERLCASFVIQRQHGFGTFEMVVRVEHEPNFLNIRVFRLIFDLKPGRFVETFAVIIDFHLAGWHNALRGVEFVNAALR